MYRRGRRRRSGGARSVIQSYKKVIDVAPTSRGAGANIAHAMSEGIDSVAAGQTSPTDDNVPTGSIIKAFYINYCTTNLVAISQFMFVSIQLLRTGQSLVSPRLVGGDPQRNQVFYQKMYSVGKEQNSTLAFWFKVPKSFQRVRDGDRWQMIIQGTAVHTDAFQCVYKFYR